jgi:hypothetical protein
MLYPSHSSHGNALLASFVWEDDANLLTSFSNASLVELVLKGLQFMAILSINLISVDQELLSNGFAGDYTSLVTLGYKML